MCVVILITLAPAIAQIAASLIPVVIAVAVVVAALRLLWFYTGRW